MSTPQDALSAAFVAAGHSPQDAEELVAGIATTALVDDNGATDPDKVAAVVQLHDRVTTPPPRDYGAGDRLAAPPSLNPGAEEALRRFGPKPDRVLPGHHGPTVRSGRRGAEEALRRFGLEAEQ
jgi:hypothetical protein